MGQIPNFGTPPPDSSLTISGKAADAKVVGDKINSINNQLTANGLSFHFAVDSRGNYGYYMADGSIASFKKNYAEKIFSTPLGEHTSITVTLAQYGDYDSLIFIPIFWQQSGGLDASSICMVNSGTNCTYRLVSEAIKPSMVVRCYQITPIDRTKDLSFTCSKTGDGYTLLGLR